MPIVRDIPNTEALVTAWLRDQLSGLSNRVYTGIPKEATFPLVTAKRLGGIAKSRYALDAARIQLDCWADSKTSAFDTAVEVRTAMFAMEAMKFLQSDGWPQDAYVTAVEDDQGLIWLPDSSTNRDRYILGFMIFAHVI